VAIRSDVKIRKLRRLVTILLGCLWTEHEPDLRTVIEALEEIRAQNDDD
jgi:hypothetical protein